MTDMAVAQQAYATAKALGADGKIMLALFEAGIVESNFTNDLTATDHDSLGYLQQRPSQGWPDPTNVVTATTSFVNKAKIQEAAHPDYSAGQLAQSVQVSAFPDRYDQASGQAQSLLAQVSGNPLSATPASSITSVGNLQKVLTMLSDTHNWIRFAEMSVGFIAMFIGFVVLVKDTTVADQVTQTAKKVAEVAIVA